MLQDLFSDLKHELRGAMSQRKHPFKYITLSTVNRSLQPRSRTVVLREVSESLECIIFTDSRTHKVTELMGNSNACLLAYHPKKLLQLRLDGVLEPITEATEVKRLFQKVSSKAIKDYTTENAPGTKIKNPDNVNYVARSENHFLPLRFVPHTIEYLKLKRPNHLRALFVKQEDWIGEWLVP